jgi:hypothetical protein
MSGVFYIGLGDEFDGDKVKAYPPGSVIVLPGNTSHFHWAKSGEYVTQVTGIGPLGIEYLESRQGSAPKSDATRFRRLTDPQRREHSASRCSLRFCEETVGMRSRKRQRRSY